MVRKASRSDLPEILSIYKTARAYMAAQGNGTQWGDKYPLPEQMEADISLGRMYVICDEKNEPHGVFVYMLEAEPSYASIDGKWLNDRPYGTIHRLAGDGTIRGVFHECLEFCSRICPNTRADTHKNNKTMQHLLEKHGFTYCGTINLDKKEGDTLRLAYQREG